MPTHWTRDLEADGKKLQDWLVKQLPTARDLCISELVSPQSSGFSNETLLFDLDYREGGEKRREKLVVRIEPIGYRVFPEYDMRLQYRTMELLGPTDVPVPRTFGFEQDKSLLGGSFYVMSQIEGRVPSDQPPYHQSGWLSEANPEEREAIWWGGVDALAKIHSLDYRALGFDFLDKPELGTTGLDQQMAYYRNFLDWAAAGRAQPIAEAAWNWLSANKPADEGEVDTLLWGDARIGNIIFDGTRPAAVLDWEMVSHGPPEADLGWMIFLDRHHSEGIETPRLEGFPSYEASIARYESHTGRSVRDLHFYEVWAGFRFAAIMIRIAGQLVEYEIMDEATGREFEKNNTVTRLIAKILEISAPGESNAGFGG